MVRDLRKVATAVTITDEELRNFYDKNANQMKGAKFENIREDFKNYLLAQKQDAAVETFIKTIKAKTTVYKERRLAKGATECTRRKPVYQGSA